MSALRVLRLVVLAGGLAVLTTILPGAVPCCELRYRVKPYAEAGVVDVRLSIHGFRGDTLVLRRPSARPLTGLLAQDPRVEGARPVSWSLVAGAPTWKFVRPDEGWRDPVRVAYRLAITAQRPFNAWSVGLDQDLLYAPAEALFLVPDMSDVAARDAPIEVAWDLPPGWDAFTGWERDQLRGVRTLIRTNVLAGRIQRRNVAACGLEIQLGVQGDWSFDTDALASDLARLACAARYRLGRPAVDRYAVSLAPARFPMTSGNRNGPHAIGFVHMLPDGEPPSIRLLAHELGHLWQRFDAPPWFQEGVDDYMALRLAHEAELIDDERYQARLATIDSIYRANPHRARWSFAEEGDEAPPFGPSDEYLSYRKGALVGLALDRELRLRTGGEIELATLWREMNRRADWGHVRWTDAEIQQLAATLVDGGMGHFFATWVDGTRELPAPALMLANLPDPPAAAPAQRGLGAIAAFLQTLFVRDGR